MSQVSDEKFVKNDQPSPALKSKAAMHEQSGLFALFSNSVEVHITGNSLRNAVLDHTVCDLGDALKVQVSR